MDYADLEVIDLNLAKTIEGRHALAAQVRDAMRTSGFFYCINHGYTQEQVSLLPLRVILGWSDSEKEDRIFDIADVPFARVTPEEKQQYVGKMKEAGSYQGYKPRSYWVRYFCCGIVQGCDVNRNAKHIDAGVQDQNEHYNGTLSEREINSENTDSKQTNSKPRRHRETTSGTSPSFPP